MHRVMRCAEDVVQQGVYTFFRVSHGVPQIALEMMVVVIHGVARMAAS